MNRMALALTAALLASCATFSNMEAGLSSLVGKPATNAFALIGYPDAKVEVDGATVYTWSSSRQESILIPTTATTTGRVGSHPVYATTTTTSAMPVEYSCTIKIVADPDGTIRRWDYQGNVGGCESYASRLKTAVRGKLQK